MSKSDHNANNRPLGAAAYAAIASVEGLKLTEAGRRRLEESRRLPQDERRAIVLRAYKSDKPAHK